MTLRHTALMGENASAFFLRGSAVGWDEPYECRSLDEAQGNPGAIYPGLHPGYETGEHPPVS